MYDKANFEAARAMTLDMLHNEGTSKQVVNMLGAGEPMKTIPETAAQLNQQIAQAFEGKGKELSLENIIANSVVMAAELIDIANTAGITQITEQDAPAVLEMTTKQAIQAGLESGKIDPVELQEVMNEEMPPNMKKAGLAQEGVPNEANDMVAMEQYAQQRMRQQQGGMLNGV